MDYDSNHHRFLRHFMYHKVVSVSIATSMHCVLFPNKDIIDTITAINQSITPFKIVKTRSEPNGEQIYVFIALFSELAENSDDLIFPKVAEYIITNGGSVHTEKLLQFNPQMSEELLHKLFINKYCFADEENKIYLTALTMRELNQYLTKRFKHRICACCSIVVSSGTSCPSCFRIVHGYCLKDYTKATGDCKCPKC